MKYIKMLLILVIVVINFILIGLSLSDYNDGKQKEKNIGKYTTEQSLYNNAYSVASKVPFLVNIRTKKDYNKLEASGNTYLTDELYNDLLKGKAYADYYAKSNIEVVSIRGTRKDEKQGNFLFKVELLREGVKEVHLVTIANGIITQIRSLGNV